MTINHNPTLKAGDVADMYHTGTDRFYEATVVKLLADHEARERFRAGRRVPPGRAVPAYEMTRSEVLEWVRMHGGDTGHFVSDAACDDFTAQLEERLPSNVDTQRCIDARNALNDVIHGEGAVIDDLEGIVAEAVVEIKRLRATNVEAAQLAVVDQGRQKTPSYREKQELRERIKELEIEISACDKRIAATHYRRPARRRARSRIEEARAVPTTRGVPGDDLWRCHRRVGVPTGQLDGRAGPVGRRQPGAS
jgi:hypothetical protein